jgi:hypothetical protein
MREYRLKNRERMNKSSREYNQRNRDKISKKSLYKYIKSKDLIPGGYTPGASY